MPGLQGGPHNHTIMALGVALQECMDKEYTEYTKQIFKKRTNACPRTQPARIQNCIR